MRTLLGEIFSRRRQFIGNSLIFHILECGDFDGTLVGLWLRHESVPLELSIEPDILISQVGLEADWLENWCQVVGVHQPADKNTDWEVPLIPEAVFENVDIAGGGGVSGSGELAQVDVFDLFYFGKQVARHL